jgi:flagellar biosynthesis protein FliQ
MSNALALDLMRSAIQMALVVAAPMLVAACSSASWSACCRP